MIERPYVSPLGNAGAIIAAVIALTTLYVLFLNPDYRLGVYGCVAWYAAGLLYSWLIGRKKLVYSPEEEFAVKHSGQAKNGLTVRRSLFGPHY